MDFPLHALAVCVTTTFALHAARGITIAELSTELEGDIVLQGLPGLDGSTDEANRSSRDSAFATQSLADHLRHRSEQYRTFSQSRCHFLRHVNGLPQVAQSLVGRSAFFMRGLAFMVMADVAHDFPQKSIKRGAAYTTHADNSETCTGRPAHPRHCEVRRKSLSLHLSLLGLSGAASLSPRQKSAHGADLSSVGPDERGAQGGDRA